MTAQPSDHDEEFTPDELAAFDECDAWIAAGCPGAKTHEEFMAELGLAR